MEETPKEQPMKCGWGWKRGMCYVKVSKRRRWFQEEDGGLTINAAQWQSLVL